MHVHITYLFLHTISFKMEFGISCNNNHHQNKNTDKKIDLLSMPQLHLKNTLSVHNTTRTNIFVVGVTICSSIVLQQQVLVLVLVLSQFVLVFLDPLLTTLHANNSISTAPHYGSWQRCADAFQF